MTIKYMSREQYRLKLHRGSRISITLHPKSKFISSQAPPVPTSRPEEGLLPVPEKVQRLIPGSPQAQGIILWDLGYLQGVPNLDLPFEIVPTVNMTGDPVRAIDLTDYEARDAFLFDFTPPEDYESTFVRVMPSMSDVYGFFFDNGATVVNVENDSDEWVDDRFVLPSSFFSGDTFEVANYYNSSQDSRYFWFFNLKGTGRNRITTTFDKDADDYPGFVPSNNMTIYVLPLLVISRGEAYLLGGSTKQYLNYIFTVGGRSRWLEPGDPFYNFPINRTAIGSSLYEDAWDAMLVEKDLLNARAFEDDGMGSRVPMLLSDFPDAAIFPPPPSTPAPGSPTEILSMSRVLDDSPIPDQALVAIVKQGSNYFYVWSDTI